MVDEYLRQGPLDFVKIPPRIEGDQETHDGSAVLIDLGLRGQIVLRGSLSVSGFADAVEKIPPNDRTISKVFRSAIFKKPSLLVDVMKVFAGV